MFNPDAPQKRIPDDEFWNYNPKLESADPDIYSINDFYYEKRGDYWYLIEDGHFRRKSRTFGWR